MASRFHDDVLERSLGRRPPTRATADAPSGRSGRTGYDRGVVTGTLDVEANISHEVDVDHPLDDVPTVVAALKAVVPAAREDRLKWELRPGLERGPVRTGRSGPSIIADLHDDVGDDVLGRRYAFVEMNGSLDELLDRVGTAQFLLAAVGAHGCFREQRRESVDVHEVKQLRQAVDAAHAQSG